MRVQIDSALCQGHGRCYDLAPDLFGDDEDGYATLTELTADGNVPPGLARTTRSWPRTTAPSRAIVLEEV